MLPYQNHFMRYPHAAAAILLQNRLSSGMADKFVVDHAVNEKLQVTQVKSNFGY